MNALNLLDTLGGRRGRGAFGDGGRRSALGASSLNGGRRRSALSRRRLDRGSGLGDTIHGLLSGRRNRGRGRGFLDHLRPVGGLHAVNLFNALHCGRGDVFGDSGINFAHLAGTFLANALHTLDDSRSGIVLREGSEAEGQRPQGAKRRMGFHKLFRRAERLNSACTRRS